MRGSRGLRETGYVPCSARRSVINRVRPRCSRAFGAAQPIYARQEEISERGGDLIPLSFQSNSTRVFEMLRFGEHSIVTTRFSMDVQSTLSRGD